MTFSVGSGQTVCLDLMMTSTERVSMTMNIANKIVSLENH
jgi:hypothetical protein